MSLMRRIYCSYNFLLFKYPYKVQAVQVTAILAVGDAIAQTIVARREHFDVERNLKFMSAGLILGPTLHYWYVLLEKLYGKSKNIKTVMLKVTTDQLIFGPLCLAALLTYIQVLHGHSADDIKRTLRVEYPYLLRDSYMFWPAAQMVNFTIIPLNFRVVFIQILAVLWNTYLAWRVHGNEESSRQHK